ncbi:MAG: lysophospholipid acyltransferase family protein [Planctomycetes bacterium]|nr:lysophospholipid acyltransferase family protein [Planctomycetota bacterium]
MKDASAYIKRRFKDAGFLKQYWHVYLLFINQGKALVDRYAVASGYQGFRMHLKGFDVVQNIVNQGEKGCILLTSHTGNWQLALSCLKELNKDIYLLMRQEDNKAVKNYLKIDEEEDKVKVISPEQDFGGTIEVMEKLNKGDVVSIMGDRKYGFPTVDINFIGDMAGFPFGAFSIAATLECPIIVLLTAKNGHKEYCVDFKNIILPKYKSKKDKKQQLEKYVQEYANVLNNYAESYPYQVFLFADIWQENKNKGELCNGRRE